MRVYLVCLLAIAAVGSASAQTRPPAAKDSSKPKAKDKSKDKIDNDDKDETPPRTGADTVGGKTLKEWMTESTVADPSRRVSAVLAIASFGDKSTESLKALLERVSDTDVSPKTKAIVALRYVPVQEKDVKLVVATLATRLLYSTEQQAVVRYETLITLGRFAEDCKPHLPRLINCMTDGSSWEIRHASVSVVWRAARDEKNGPDDKAVKAFVGRLQASKYPATYQEKLELIVGLGSMGRSKNTALYSEVMAVFQLYAATKSQTAQARSLSLWAYAGLVSLLDDPKQGEEELGRIAKYLGKNFQPEIRVQASAALGVFGDRSKKHVPTLLLMLDDKEAVIANAAANALVAICKDKDAKVIDAMVSHVTVYAQPKKDATATEKNNSLSKAAAGVYALVGMKANVKSVHDALDKLRDNKEIDGQLRLLIEQAQKHLREPPKDKDKK